MQYISTRGKSRATGAEALVYGLAGDGGLFVPEHLPAAQSWEKWTDADYRDIATEVLHLFFPDWSEEICRTLVEKAYQNTFQIPGVVEVKKTSPDYWLTELFHGRTLAFKDLALSLFPHLLQQAKKDLGMEDQTLILTATSGDTGKAALEGFRDVEGIEIAVFYPQYGVSPMQQAQMQTQAGENVQVWGIEGNFDDAQTFVKEVFENEEMRRYAAEHRVHFSSANSINVGRLIPQIVYYIRSYTELLRQGAVAAGEYFDVAVPTGNFGNILAGFLAKKMGVPIGQLVCASNKNHVLADFFADGVYDRRREFYATSSPSMDILISSNFERYLYYLTDGNTAEVERWMSELKEQGYFRVPKEVLSSRTEIIGGWADEAATIRKMTAMYEQEGYLLDPHTAVACAVVDDLRAKGRLQDRPMVVMATAHPYKFPDAVAQAVGVEVMPDPYLTLQQVAEKSGCEIPASFQAMAAQKKRFTEMLDKDQMESAVRQLILHMEQKKRG